MCLGAAFYKACEVEEKYLCRKVDDINENPYCL